MDFRKYLILVILFLILTCLVVGFPIVTTCDIYIISLVQKIMSKFSTTIPLAIGDISYGAKYWVPILTVALILIIMRKYVSCFLFVLFVECSVCCSDLLKNLICRHRPPIDMQVTHITTFSFPSGHSVLNMCFWGMCIYLVERYVSNNILKWILVSLCSFMILFVGYTRLWLGVHYPTDVVAGYLLGAFFVLLFADVEKRLQKN